jgi:DNA-binding transcriptional regulator LsrR (DeoR family)
MFNEKINYVAPMDGEAIAHDLGITRQAVSQMIKRALNKCYSKVSKMNRDMSPFKRTCLLMSIFNIVDDEEAKKFIKLFPQNIRRDIIKDAANYK